MLEEEHDEINTRRDRLQADLKTNYYRSREELRGRLASLSVDAGETSLETADIEINTARSELDFAVANLSVIQAEVAALGIVVNNKKAEVTELESELDNHRVQEEAAQATMNEAAKRQDKLLNKRTMLDETVQHRQRQIRELGTLPRRELDKFSKLGEKKLLENLKSANEGLKKFSSVNKKALEQFVSFNEQRDVLIERKNELERDSQSIKELIENLDAQKEEAILRTFSGVSKHFSDVFSELVPGGEGQLVMIGAMDDNGVESDNEGDVPKKKTGGDDSDGGGGSDDDESDGDGGKKKSSKKAAAKGKSKKSKPGKDSSAKKSTSKDSSKRKTIDIQEGSVSAFKGVQVRVTFSGTGQQFEMQQLSGGQKALVALALIFAIQRCDPAPFYLFDEIDQALDANYRSGVARLIQKQVESKEAPAQFITTTFRPELVAVANKCYGIALLNKVSNIYPMEKV